MCESHSRPPGLSIFTTISTCEWFLKSCITIKTHCVSLFQEERLIVVDNWLEFQNNVDISKEILFASWISVLPGSGPTRCCCVANVISLYLNV